MPGYTVETYSAIAERALEKREALFEQRKAIVANKDIPSDQRRAKIEVIDAEMDALAAEAREAVETAEQVRAGQDQAQRGARLAAATRVPGGSTDYRGGARIEARHNEPLPTGASFSDLTDKPADFRDFGKAARALVYGNPSEFRAAGEGTDSAGGFLVAPRYAATVLDLMRPATQVVNAGATVVPLDSDNVTIAKVVGDPSPQWRSENAAIAESDITFGGVNFRAKALSVVVKASWELIEDAENFGAVLAQSLANAFAVKLDNAALYGSGTDPEVNGLINQVTNTATYPSTGLTDYDPLIAAVQSVRMSNFVPTASIMSEANYGALAAAKDANNAYLTPPAYLADVPNLPTTAIDDQGDGAIFTGDFRNLYIGVRTSFEIKVLNERYADTGQVGFVGWLRADVQNARSEAFCLSTPSTS